MVTSGEEVTNACNAFVEQPPWEDIVSSSTKEETLLLRDDEKA